MSTGKTFEVDFAGDIVRVRIRQDPATGGAFVSLDGGEEIEARLESLGGPLYVLSIDGRQHEVVLTSTGTGDVRLWLGGQSVRARVLDEPRALAEHRANQRTTAVRDTDVKAPMPGLVVHVLCRSGDQVEAGQPLVVLRAMKMENELSAPTAGTIVEVCVAVGEIVEQDQVLARLT